MIDALSRGESFRGATLAGLQVPKLSISQPVCLEECDLRASIWPPLTCAVPNWLTLSCRSLSFRANLSGANFTRATLTGADLSSADLSGANLSGADLTGANLDRAILRGCQLQRCH